MLQRLNSEKAPEVGIRAWSESGLGRPRVATGGGRRRRASSGRWTSWPTSLGVDESVEFLGSGDRHRRPAGPVVDPSGPAPEEPFGLSVVEAMAHGIPVVAARGGGHLETVADSGVLFSTQDPKAAGEALAELGASRPIRLRMGHDLRLRQQQMYALSTHVDRLEALYADVIDAAGSRRPTASSSTDR